MEFSSHLSLFWLRKKRVVAEEDGVCPHLGVCQVSATWTPAIPRSFMFVFCSTPCIYPFCHDFYFILTMLFLSFLTSAAPTPSGIIHFYIEVAVACIMPVFNLKKVHVCPNWLQSSSQSHSPLWSATVDNPSAFFSPGPLCFCLCGFLSLSSFFCPCWFLFFYLCLSSLLPLLLTFSSPYFLIFSSVCSFLLQVFSVPLCFIPSVFRFLLHWVSCVSVRVVFLWGTSPSSSVTVYQIRSCLNSLPFPYLFTVSMLF